MEVRKPLTEIGWCQVQRPRPRRKMDKVYGKANSKFRIGAGQDIFTDENDVVDHLAGLKIKQSPLSENADEEELGGHRHAQALNSPAERKGKKQIATSCPEVKLGRPCKLADKLSAVKLKRAQAPPELEHDTPSEELTDNPFADLRVIFKSEELDYVRPVCDEAAEKWNRELQTFQQYAKTMSKRYIIKKLAEGSYGDCYKANAQKCSITNPRRSEIILKIIPIQSAARASSMDASSIPQIVHEVKVHKAVDSCAGFVRFYDVSVVQGMYPENFLTLFRDWKTLNPGMAYNKDPKERFNSRQQFAIFGMSHAGIDLENMQQPSAFQIFDVFWSLVILLANAERSVQFEHRDLHVGNVCYEPRFAGGRIDIKQMENKWMDEVPRVKLGLASLRLTLIDYTLSRATLRGETDHIAYHSMENFDFDSTSGNEEEKYQFTVYRRMRNCIRKVYTDAPKSEQEGSPWKRFVPKTNVCWLIYVLQILCNRSGGRTLEDSSEISEDLQKQMFEQFNEILGRYKECSVGRLPESAGDLLDVGIMEDWLCQEDVESFTKYLSQSQA